MTTNEKESRNTKRINDTEIMTYILENLRGYGFIECSQVIRFIELVSLYEIGDDEINYIKSKIKLCLNNHDNGSDYFSEIRSIYDYLKEMI